MDPRTPEAGNAALLADLARVQALFQLRAIAVHMGFPQPRILALHPDASKEEKYG